MQVNHAPGAVSARFDDRNLVSAAGLVPALRLAQGAGLSVLARQRLTVPTDKGANAGAKTASLVAGMLAGADSIDDMNVLRHGGMGRLFGAVYAPSTLGSFLRTFSFGHVRQLDSVAAGVLANLAGTAPLLGDTAAPVFVDIDDSVIEVYGHQKQAAGFGYTRVRGLNALLATAITAHNAPVIIASRLRRGKVNSPRGAGSFIAEALRTLRRLTGTADRPVMVRADSGFFTRAVVNRAIRAGADVSITIRNSPSVRAAIGSIPDDAWTPIRYPRAVRDEQTGQLISDAEVAEVPFTAFTGNHVTPYPGNITGRLIVRRVKARHGPGLFTLWRYHAFFTTSTLDTVTTDRVHRAHAIIEQVHSDLKNGPLAHLPSGKFAANSAWLVLATIAFNIARATAIIADTHGPLAKATTATIRRTLIQIPARVARSARRIVLHLPEAWPWQDAFTRLFTSAHAPPLVAPT